ncbi:pyrimidine utilization protein D [Acuticoccus sediminis]|uniref:Pyrimidine utilization protein D n=1 Tax=Acuticoccus sediminis TaxID=2184697 RepID=A0A8B2NM27_9HYPH|nr:alpha/beta hydrolase [Acuticoccus sediminis]RAI00667.1 pyrimidine utilization protein D [Acuticoccus sediminis]
MATLERPDGTLVYDVAGEGPPLFLVSGLGGSRRYWDNLLPALTAEFTVVTHDHMGTGETISRRTAHTVEALAEDVVALMDHLKIDAAHVLGHSTGAAVGQVLGETAPERLRRLILFAGWPGPDPVFDMCFEMRRHMLADSGMEPYQRSTPIFLYPPRWIAENIEMCRAVVDGLIALSPPVETMLARIDMIVRFDRRDRLALTGGEPLIVCARDDILTPPHCSEAMAAGIPGARLALLEWGGHAVSQTDPAAFLDVILPELRRG